MKFLCNFFIGILIGCGAILPGVSSGVFCVIFGIYEKLVDSLTNLFKDFKNNFLYLLPIALGAFVGIVLFGNFIKFLFISYEVQARFIFIGLILGTIPALFKQASEGKKSFTINIRKLFPMAITFFIGISLIIFEKSLNLNALVSDFSSSPIYLVFAGFLMSIGIVVPGISNTIILMCLGVYSTYIYAISTVNLSILIPLAIGVLCGGIIWLKIISVLLKKYHQPTFYVIIGFTLGSIFVLLPELKFDATLLLNFVLFFISLILSYKLSKYEVQN
ncbi:MAG: DUF368 domain-containing protein [Clostridia bacterium]